MAAVLASGCILGAAPPEKNDSYDQVKEDAFLEDYLKKQKEPEIIDYNETSTTSTTATTTTLEARLKPCQSECCNETGTEPKGCGAGMTCANNTCVERPCPFECCVLGMYEMKWCRPPLECVNSICVKPPCPPWSECCLPDDYSDPKACAWGFACRNSTCYTIDTDGDRLDDVVERSHGTNENISDTDGDGLSDYDEVKVYRTDPLNQNTDGDRLPDGQDKNPLVTDSALVNVTVASNEVTVNFPVVHQILMYLDFGQASPRKDDKVAEFSTNIHLENAGTDYTDYVRYNYEIGYWCAGGRDVRRKPFVMRYFPNGINITEAETPVAYRGDWNDTINGTSWRLKDIPYTAKRLDAGVKYIRHIYASLLFGDLTNETMTPIVSDRRCFYNVSIKDAEYEKYGLY